MIYVLIFVWLGGYGDKTSTSQSIEFYSAEACQAAAKEIRRQGTKEVASVPLLVCAYKGVKK